MTSNAENVKHLPSVSLDDDFIPLVKPGIYTMGYSHHETRMFFNKQPKVVFWFKIVDMGKNFETILPRYYNVKKLKGKACKGGGFVPGRSSDFIREYCRLFSNRLNRLDRIPLSLYSNTLIRAKVRTVDSDRRQASLPTILRYSVIEEVLGVSDA